MFSENHKISLRQTFRLFTVDFIGISTLIVPGYLAQNAGVYGVASILIGGVLGLVYLVYLGIVLKKMDTDLFGYVREHPRLRGGVRKILYTYLAFSCVMTAADTAATFSDLIQRSLIREESYVLILALILIVGVYAVSSGIESRARVYEVSFWLILIPLILMLLFSLKGVNTIYWQPLSQLDGYGILKGSYMVFITWQTLFFILLFPAYLSKETKLSKLVGSVGAALLCAIVLLLVVYIILLLTFGEMALADMKYPIITLMSTVQISGGFVKRLDALMMGIWFFTLYALLNLNLHYGAQMLAEGWISQKRKNVFRQWGPLILIAVLVFIAALCLWYLDGAKEFFEKYFVWIGVPVYLLLPGAIVLGQKTNKTHKKPGQFAKKMTAGVGILLLICNLTGCKATELEDKSFPMMAIVDYDLSKRQVGFTYIFPVLRAEPDAATEEGDGNVDMTFSEDFRQAYQQYEMRLNKEADYNHLKVLVMSEAFLEEDELYESMLDMLWEQETFPRNTYVCVTDMPEELMEAEETLSEDLGSYVEDLLENHEFGKETELPTLGGLMDEQKNQCRVWDIPFLEVDNGTIIWDGFYRVEKGIPKGKVSGEFM